MLADVSETVGVSVMKMKSNVSDCTLVSASLVDLAFVTMMFALLRRTLKILNARGSLIMTNAFLIVVLFALGFAYWFQCWIDTKFCGSMAFSKRMPDSCACSRKKLHHLTVPCVGQVLPWFEMRLRVMVSFSRSGEGVEIQAPTWEILTRSVSEWVGEPSGSLCSAMTL